MAIYISPTTRRRRAASIAIVAVIAGLTIGYLIGRSAAPSIDDSVSAVQAQAADAVTALQRITIEYGQAIRGSGGESTRTITEAVDNARIQLDLAYEDAIWLWPAQRAATDAAFDGVYTAVEAGASQSEFERAIDSAAATIKLTFGPG